MHCALGRLMLETLGSYILGPMNPSTYIASDPISALHGLVAHPCRMATLPSRYFQCT